jgi:divinyl protochlorophyllide a 8-vinyl-reductase
MGWGGTTHPHGTGGRIGPNAILQLAGVLVADGGLSLRDRVLDVAGVAMPPPDAGMWPEDDCRAVHLAVRQVLPAQADRLLWRAGLATAEYILAHRIPRAAQAVLRRLPASIARRLLAKAIARNAWTFAGSGQFRVVGHHPLTFEIAGNPLAAAPCGRPSCHWHVAVFERLFSALTRGGVTVTEVSCTAAGDATCRFVLLPARRNAARAGGCCGDASSCGTHGCQ